MSERTRRPDLEALAVSYPEYLCDKVFPYLGKNQEAGKLYYQPYGTDVTAQYNRTMNSSSIGSITGNIYASANVSYTCVETRARIVASYTEVKQAGNNLQALQESMARRAKRGYYNKIEALTADALLNVDSPTAASSGTLAAIESAVTAQRDKGLGRVAVVLSNHNFVTLKGNDDIKARMQNTGVAVAGLDPRAITATQMAAVFGADEVLVGRDDIWYTGLDAADRPNIAVVCLPDIALEPVEEAQLGRTVFYEFDSLDRHYVIESFHDDGDDCEVVDCKGLIAVQLLNAGLASVLAISASSSSSSSSI